MGVSTLRCSKVIFNLVKPACIDQRMYMNSFGVPEFKAIDKRLTSVRRAIVGHPKYLACRSILLLAHDKIDQVMKSVYSSAVPAQAKDFSQPNISGCHVSQISHSSIFMLNTAIAPSSRSGYRSQTAACLNAGLFIGGDKNRLKI